MVRKLQVFLAWQIIIYVWRGIWSSEHNEEERCSQMEARGVHNTNLVWVHHSICKAQWNKYYKRCPFNKIESHNFLPVDIKNSVIHCIFPYIHSISMIFSIANKFYLYNKIHWIMNFRTFNPLRNVNIWLYWCFQLEAKKEILGLFHKKISEILNGTKQIFTWELMEIPSKNAGCGRNVLNNRYII